jgi:hypothetical protein
MDVGPPFKAHRQPPDAVQPRQGVSCPSYGDRDVRWSRCLCGRYDARSQPPSRSDRFRYIAVSWNPRRR